MVNKLSIVPQNSREISIQTFLSNYIYTYIYIDIDYKIRSLKIEIATDSINHLKIIMLVCDFVILSTMDGDFYN